MGWINTFLEKLMPTTQRVGGKTVVIDIPAIYYYRELAVYTAVSLIAHAIGRSEFKVYRDNKQVQNEEYFVLNVSPNRNETSSAFWHKVINRMVRNGEALVVELGGRLYCADSYVREQERPTIGDVYSDVTIGPLTLKKRFTRFDSYLFKLDDVKISTLINGMYEDYGKMIATAATSYQMSNGQKYKLHIESVKAGDPEFNEEFQNVIEKQLKAYMQSTRAVYPEFDGYELVKDPAFSTAKDAGDFVKLMNDVFTMVAGCFHIPQSMMTGNITNIKDVVSSFLTFGVDPFADAISEGLNKGSGYENFAAGNYYKVDTGRVAHRNILDAAAEVSGIIGSGVVNIDEVRSELGYEQLNTEWSKKHFVTKNFEEIERFLKDPAAPGKEVKREE